MKANEERKKKVREATFTSRSQQHTNAHNMSSWKLLGQNMCVCINHDIIHFDEETATTTTITKIWLKISTCYVKYGINLLWCTCTKGVKSTKNQHTYEFSRNKNSRTIDTFKKWPLCSIRWARSFISFAPFFCPRDYLLCLQ